MDEYGIPIFGDEVDYDEVDLIGHRLQKVYDYSYDTDAECDDRVVAQLRKHDAAKKQSSNLSAADRLAGRTTCSARVGVSYWWRTAAKPRAKRRV